MLRGEVEQSAGVVGAPGEVLGVPQKHRPLLSDAVAMVKLHQFIERGEELVPHVVLTAAVLENLEMLNVIPITDRHGKLSRSTFAFPDQKSSTLSMSESVFCYTARYATGKPGMRPQIDIVFWHKALFVVELSSVPVWVILHVGDLE